MIQSAVALAVQVARSTFRQSKQQRNPCTIPNLISSCSTNFKYHQLKRVSINHNTLQVSERNDDNEEEKQQVQSPDQYELGENEKVPLLFVDVNLGTDGQERIVVYDGDTAKKLAEEFCADHCKFFFLICNKSLTTKPKSNLKNFSKDRSTQS